MDILAEYGKLLADEPHLLPRDAAGRLGISEGALLAARMAEGGDSGTVIRLTDTPQAILESVHKLGRVRAITRNAHCVHEKTGIYTGGGFSPKDGEEGAMPKYMGQMGMFVGPDIDLRLFMNHWRFCFATRNTRNGGGEGGSLQFFDKAGEAVHKIMLTEESDAAAFDSLIAEFTAPTQNPAITPAAYPPPQQSRADVDWPAFRKAWAGMQDTLQLNTLLRQFGLTKTAAFAGVGAEFAQKTQNTAARTVLESVAASGIPMMIFAGNRGCIQIHSGQIKTLMDRGGWFNIADPGFHLHLETAGIDETWLVRKPTARGIITSLEIFAADGTAIATFFGKRNVKSGEGEPGAWRDLVTTAAALRK